MSAELFYEILLAEMAGGQGDLSSAHQLMLEAARSAQSEQLFRRATELGLQSRSGERALAAAKEWKASFPQSRDANRFVLQILIALNRVSETVQPLQQEIALTPAPSKPATFLAIAQLYSRVSDKPLAAAVVEQAFVNELKDPVSGAAAWATVGHLRVIAEQKQLALEAAKQSFQMSPNNGAAALLALELMEANVPEAEPIVQGYLQNQPAATIRLAYARVLMGYDRNDAALEQLQILTKESPEFPDAWLALAGMYYEKGEWKPAQEALQQFIPLADKHPDSHQRQSSLTQAYLLNARIAIKQNDLQDASQWLAKIEGGESNLNVQALRATVLAKQDKLPQARALIRAVPTRNAEQDRLKRRAEIQLLRDSNAPQEAYLLQRSLFDQAPDNNDMAYETAILAEQAGKYETAESLLRAIIERDPSYHHAYNALGYSFAERGIRLEEARTLIEKALELAPEDPFIMDSLGWVEFQQGHTEKALEILEKAYGLRSDVDIGAHLGEVLWKRGDTRRARALWKDGLQRDPENKTLRSTLDRLQVKP